MIIFFQETMKHRKVFEKQNALIIRSYKAYSCLWNKNEHHLITLATRTNILANIQKYLQKRNIQLTIMAISQRIQSLRKCYSVEKIRYLQCQMEEQPFEPKFKHFKDMNFLNKHIEPFVCDECGKIFEHLAQYQVHLQKEGHVEKEKCSGEGLSTDPESSCSETWTTDSDTENYLSEYNSHSKAIDRDTEKFFQSDNLVSIL